MKRLSLILTMLAVISISCQDGTKKQNSENPETSEIKEENKDSEKYFQEEKDLAENSEKETRIKEKIEGDIYLKTGEENDISCKCFCLDVNIGGSSELCLSKDKIYVNARFESTEDGIDIFYQSPSAKNTNKKMPWNKFDKNIPIASLTPTADGLKLDWKGFSIDGELAVDYAIYGKKTLEGEYKIKK